MNGKSQIVGKKPLLPEIRDAVQAIKMAILKSQANAAQSINSEQLSLYYGIGRFVAENSRKDFWGTGAIENISRQLKSELPGLKGFSPENIKLMRRFYEAWQTIEADSVVQTTGKSVVRTTDLQEPPQKTVRQLRLTNDEEFPVTAFLNISFTHHVAIFRYAKNETNKTLA